jgi:ferredoxin-NADP reductase
MKKEIMVQLEGYNEIARDNEALRRYGHDYGLDRGAVRDCIDRLHPDRLSLKVIDVIDESPTAKTLRLAPQEGALPPFQAGQYVTLFAEIGKVRTGRAYSISSPPHRTGHYDITVRRVADGFVSNSLLDGVKAGDTLETSGPSGNFHHNPVIHGSESVFIAGGSGITPFMSMIREIVERGLDRTVHLFYGNRTEDDVIFGDELSRITSRYANIRYHPVIETPGAGYRGLTGFITADIIRDAVKNVEGKTFFVCGPPAMYDFVTPQVAKLGIPGKKLRREMYGPPKNISAQPGWPAGVKEDAVFSVKVRGGGMIQARAGEPLLNSLERAGAVVPSLCRSGECSMCRVKLLSGKVYQPEGVLLRKSDRIYGYIHSCAAFPLEDLEILI